MDHVSDIQELNWSKWTELPSVVPFRNVFDFAASDNFIDRLC